MMRFKFFVFIFLTITTYTAHGSLIENFLNGAKSFWPRINGEKLRKKENISRSDLKRSSNEQKISLIYIFQTLAQILISKNFHTWNLNFPLRMISLSKV